MNSAGSEKSGGEHAPDGSRWGKWSHQELCATAEWNRLIGTEGPLGEVVENLEKNFSATMKRVEEDCGGQGRGPEWVRANSGLMVVRDFVELIGRESLGLALNAVQRRYIGGLIHDIVSAEDTHDEPESEKNLLVVATYVLQLQQLRRQSTADLMRQEQGAKIRGALETGEGA